MLKFIYSIMNFSLLPSHACIDKKLLHYTDKRCNVNTIVLGIGTLRTETTAEEIYYCNRKNVQHLLHFYILFTININETR